jgi:flavin reductase (DIM6/NTAB) family NADH-FMN oxidoreductase RutF
MSSCPYLASAVIDGPVGLVTAAEGGRRNVMTVSSFAESSHLPVLVRVAIAPAAWTHELVRASGWFGLSVLASHQGGLAMACGASSGRDGSKFDRLRLLAFEGPGGVPLLPGCLTTSACRVVERHELGEHTLFVGEIVASYRQSALADRRALVVSDLFAYLGPPPEAR